MKNCIRNIAFLLVSLFGIITISNAQTIWSKIGNDIDGEVSWDYFGSSVSLSSDGTIMAAGAPGNDQNGTGSGHVRVYQYTSGSWTQMGSDIDGEAGGDYSGTSISLSSDGSIVAIGAYGNDGNGNQAGHVRVYQYSSGNWTQMGNDIDGEAAGDFSGYSVSLSSDGSIVAIGAYENSGSSVWAGHVRIYEYSSGNWSQLGSDIDGEATGDRSGYSVSLNSDGTVVAIGANQNDGTGSLAGHVRVYEYSVSNWVQKGGDIDGEAAQDQSGYSVSLSSDGSIVAVGAKNNDGTASDAGHVRVYQYSSGNWTQMGSDIDGEAGGDNSGTSVSLNSNGSIVAIGAINNADNGVQAGHVRVYQYSSGNWTQIGNDIDGEASGDVSGKSVNLSSDGSYVAIGAEYNDGSSSNSGHVRVYKLCGSSSSINITACNLYTSPSGNYTWTTSGAYTDIIPNTAGCDSVITIDLTVNNSSSSSITETVCSTYTSPSGNYTWTNSGVYNDTIPNAVGCDSVITIDLTIQQSYSNISPVVCNTYTSPSGNYTWTSSGIYNDTIPNIAGCDSVITINLTVNYSSSSSITETVCDTYTSPSGNYTWTSSGIYNDTIPNAVGCDSVITIDLTINNSSGSSITEIVCDIYTSPSGNYNWTSSGIYNDTLPNTVGCDSIITINLTVNNSSSSSITETACDTYTSPSGNYNWTSSGIYNDTIPNNGGCDSVITIDLTVNYSSSSSITETTCDTYISPSGNYTWTSSGIYNDTIPNAVGCDSLITIDLTINNSSGSSIIETACYTYTSPSGNYIWTSSGTYNDTIPNIVGCDSAIVINLTINTVDTSITKNGATLTANISNATYQWLDCNNSFLPINGETSQSFTASANGSYAVEITKNGCIDTSACYSVTSVGLFNSTNDNVISVFPNPTSGKIFVKSLFDIERIRIFNANGQLIYNSFEKDDFFNITLNSKGIYFVMVYTNIGVNVEKIIVK